MRDIMQIFGKRAKSSKDAILFEGHPESDKIQTLPAGQPSPIIESYLERGFFVLEPDESGKNLYLFDSDSIEIVPADASDDSTFWGRLEGALFGLKYNTSKEIENRSSQLKRGAKIGFAKSMRDIFDLSSYVTQILIVIVALWAVFLISTFIPR